MKIALGQMHIRWEDKAANLARVESWAELLKEKNIDLFVLPEHQDLPVSIRWPWESAG